MANKLEALRALITKATDVTEADLMRYEHGGGRWAKLRDGQRELVADFYNEADREAHVAAWLALPGLLKAADEITRLNAENERLTKEADDLGEQANRWRNAWGESQVLVDEMREGLEPFAKAYDEIADGKAVWIERPINDDGSLMIQHFRQARALITKASRDSGHG